MKIPFLKSFSQRSLAPIVHVHVDTTVSMKNTIANHVTLLYFVLVFQIHFVKFRIMGFDQRVSQLFGPNYMTVIRVYETPTVSILLQTLE
jgi:hypothetical protein